MLYNRINQFLDHFNISMNAESESHSWNEFDSTTFNDLNENLTLSHIISLITQNTTKGLISGDEMLNLTEKLRQVDDGLGLLRANGSDFDATNLSDSTKFEVEVDPLYILIPFTICYLLIFVAGVLGNVITCTVISRNKSMHTATNYYLFNLAISDLILLMSGMPQDTYNLWSPFNYPFTQKICILQGLISETSTNATVLTITSFTIERYIAICHPFRQHTMSKLSRAIKFIMGIWLVAFCLAIPQAIQFGVVIVEKRGPSCTVKSMLIAHAFEVSSFLFFVGPMTLICVLYVLIGVKLRQSKLLQGVKRRGCEFGRGISGQTRVIRMLIAVAVAFFLCWAPFHAQRLMAVYGKSTKTHSEQFREIYTILTYVSGVTYFMSTCINPLLYSIMSHKFRDAFKLTIAKHCGIGGDYIKRNHTYSALSRCNGMGSFKMTIAGANNQRLSPYGNEMRRLSMSNSRNGNDGPNNPTGIQKNNKNNDINTKDDDRYRQRFVSVSSQSTLLTTISKADGNGVITMKSGDCGINNNIDTVTEKLIRSSSNPNGKLSDGINPKKHHEHSNKQPSQTSSTTTSTPSTLGTIAEKLKRRVMLFKTTSNSTSGTSSANVNNSNQQNPNCSRHRDDRKLEKGNSVDSANTNTISNSSLQEVDDDEFDSTELAKYMGQINNEIR